MSDKNNTAKASDNSSTTRIDDQKLKGVSGGKSNLSSKAGQTADAITQNLKG